MILTKKDISKITKSFFLLSTATIILNGCVKDTGTVIDTYNEENKENHEIAFYSETTEDQQSYNLNKQFNPRSHHTIREMKNKTSLDFHNRFFHRNSIFIEEPNYNYYNRRRQNNTPITNIYDSNKGYRKDEPSHIQLHKKDRRGRRVIICIPQ